MREVVVGVDASEAGALALDRGLDEAETTGRRLRAVHAWTTPVWTSGVPGLTYKVLAPPSACEALAEEVLDEVVDKGLARRTSDAPVAVTRQAREGAAGAVLLDAARDAALLVVGGRPHRRLAGVLLGSTAQHVLHHAPCPVMVVPETSAVRGARRVVVGVDGSPGSRSALRWAAEAARRHGCPLVPVRAWLLTDLPAAIPMGPPPASTQYDTAVQSWLQDEVVEVLGGEGAGDVRCAAVYGAPARVLLEQAGADDLLVVGARGHGGFAELLLGSVATQCSQHSRGTVTVVRAGQDRPER